MSFSLETQIREAWQSACARFATDGGPLIRTSPILAPADLQAAWFQCVETVKGLFAAYYGPAAVDQRFVVPEDYAVFMRVVGGGWKWRHSLEWFLFDADTVAKCTVRDFRVFVTGAEKE